MKRRPYREGGEQLESEGTAREDPTVDAVPPRQYLIGAPEMREFRGRAHVVEPPKRSPVGFDRVLVSPGVAEVALRPVGFPFRPTHLVVAADVAQHFLLEQLTVGVAPQLVARDAGIPCALLVPPASNGPELSVETILPGQNVVVLVRNVSERVVPFVAYLYGYFVR